MCIVGDVSNGRIDERIEFMKRSPKTQALNCELNKGSKNVKIVSKFLCNVK